MAEFVVETAGGRVFGEPGRPLAERRRARPEVDRLTLQRLRVTAVEVLGEHAPRDPVDDEVVHGQPDVVGGKVEAYQRGFGADRAVLLPLAGEPHAQGVVVLQQRVHGFPGRGEIDRIGS